MTDMPQEVREASMTDHERFISAVAYECGYQAGLKAGKRAGLERAANHVSASAANCRMDMIIERYGDEATLYASELLEAIAQAIRSETHG